MRNRFPDYCLKCRLWVPAGEGHPQKTGGSLAGLIKWRVKCLKCVEADREAKNQSFA